MIPHHKSPQVREDQDPIVSYFPYEAFQLIADYLNCPKTYFALRRTCRCLTQTLSPSCPVSLECFSEVIKPLKRYKEPKTWCRSDAAEWLRIASFPSVEKVDEVASHLLDTEDARKFVHAAVLQMPPRDFVHFTSDILRSLVCDVLEGSFPDTLAPQIVDACRVRAVEISSFESVKSESSLRVYLENYPPADRETWENLIRMCSDADSTNCIEMALYASQLEISDIPDIGIYAARLGDIGFIKRVYDAGVEVCEDGSDFLVAVNQGRLEACQFLLELGAKATGIARREDLFNQYTIGFNAFRQLVAKRAGADDFAFAKLLVASKVDINEATNEWDRLTLFAADFDRDNLIPMFIELGARGSIADLFVHNKGVDVSVLHSMIDSGHDINAFIQDDPFGYAITAAVARGSPKDVHLLVELKANVNVRGGTHGHTPLTAALQGDDFHHFAAKPDLSFRKIKFLLRICPSLASTPMECGTYPLGLVETYVKRRCNRKRFRKLLVSYGADEKILFGSDWIVRCFQQSPLVGYFSPRPGFMNFHRLQKWIAAGMDLNGTFNGNRFEGPNSEFFLRQDSNEALIAFLDLGGRFECEADIIHRIDQTSAFKNHASPLMDRLLLLLPDIHATYRIDSSDDEKRALVPHAVMSSHMTLFQALLRKGACIDQSAADGLTGLHVAMLGERDWKLFADILVEAGADVNARDARGQTPMFRAVLRGKLEAVDWLLDRGADATIPDDCGVRPIDIAVFAAQFQDDLDSCVTELLVPGGQRKMYSCSNRRSIVKALRRVTRDEFVEAEDSLEFAKRYGFISIDWLLADQPTDDGSQTEAADIGQEDDEDDLWDLARQQLLQELVGLDLFTTRGLRGHTALTASIAGWSVKRAPGCFSKLEVVKFLITQDPRLAVIPTSYGEYPFFFVYTTELTDSDRLAISDLLRTAGADPDTWCDNSYLQAVEAHHGELGLTLPDDLENIRNFLPLMNGRKIRNKGSDVFEGITSLEEGRLLQEVRDFYMSSGRARDRTLLRTFYKVA